MIIPREEPNVHVGGHWALLLPRPVYYTGQLMEDQPFREEIEPFASTR